MSAGNTADTAFLQTPAGLLCDNSEDSRVCVGGRLADLLRGPGVGAALSMATHTPMLPTVGSPWAIEPGGGGRREGRRGGSGVGALLWRRWRQQ